MPAITKRETRLKLQFVTNTEHSIHAGLVAVEALARRFGLWEKVRQLGCLDPRKDKRRGYSPEVILGQLIYALCSGGGCLSDSEALNEDPLARELFGVSKFADQSQVGEWLRGQSAQSVAALRRLLQEFVVWVWQQAQPARLLHAGQREVFFDDTQLELRGKQFEGAAINYNGDRALSWQTLWWERCWPIVMSAVPEMSATNWCPCWRAIGSCGKAKRPTFTPTVGQVLGLTSMRSLPRAGITPSVTTSGLGRWSARQLNCRR